MSASQHAHGAALCCPGPEHHLWAQFQELVELHQRSAGLLSCFVLDRSQCLLACQPFFKELRLSAAACMLKSPAAPFSSMHLHAQLHVASVIHCLWDSLPNAHAKATSAATEGPLNVSGFLMQCRLMTRTCPCSHAHKWTPASSPLWTIQAAEAKTWIPGWYFQN